MMMRLYCPEKNIFVDPSDHNVLVWFQQHRNDPTIGTLQTCLLYEEKRSGEKVWDEKAKRIRYPKKKTTVSGRYQLHAIPWSGFYDHDNRPIFHGDFVHDPHHTKLFICEVDVKKGVRLFTMNGYIWDTPIEEQLVGTQVTGSAILEPHLIPKSILQRFTYPQPEQP